MNPHLSDDQLLNQLYGLGEMEGQGSPHLRECAECTHRLRSFEVRRAEAVAASGLSAEVSNEVLLAQRRKVYARLDEPARLHGPWAPAALAVGFLLAVGVLFYHPGSHAASAPKMARQVAVHPVAAARSDATDDQLFSDIYSLEESVEPRAAAPIHGLFEGSDGPGEQ